MQLPLNKTYAFRKKKRFCHGKSSDPNATGAADPTTVASPPEFDAELKATNQPQTPQSCPATAIL